MNSHSETDKKQVNSTRNSEKETHPLNENYVQMSTIMFRDAFQKKKVRMEGHCPN